MPTNFEPTVIRKEISTDIGMMSACVTSASFHQLLCETDEKVKKEGGKKWQSKMRMKSAWVDCPLRCQFPVWADGRWYLLLALINDEVLSSLIDWINTFGDLYYYQYLHYQQALFILLFFSNCVFLQHSAAAEWTADLFPFFVSMLSEKLSSSTVLVRQLFIFSYALVKTEWNCS